ncbi:transglutaminase TgpA family protein [Halobaculum litoreum]|uniref:transglutaminase TgpA family protein n=1 Tax=Halobaculum litoreum TaxID=3031998 RepID=UPI0024C3DE84|nr:DUF3488 and transglutaminase-like domain-containing protein [Halobaculum sp. DT92]
MSDDGGGLRFASGPDWGRALLTVVCALGLVVSAAALPFVVGGQPAPARALLTNEDLAAQPAPGNTGDGSFGTVDGAGVDAPGDAPPLGAPDASGTDESGDASGAAGSGSGGGLGALGAQSATSVGGALAGESGESALRNQSAEVHFVVETTRPTYWRTGAFDAYTGQGWARTGESQSSDGTVDTAGLRDERIDYRVTLQKDAAAVPTAWQPARVSLPTDSLYELPGRSLASADGLPSGTTYTGVSYAPPDDPAVLASAGRDYPSSVADRYATLSENRSSDRVAAFTDELTANASSPYETAVTVERWLEANRDYSLNSSHDAEAGTVTEQFLFEMETGYCEYFATAMTVMLRTQDVPARYVVGYSAGQPTGDGEYTVRAMNAHAWVEVYFPDVGWVRFDPTPASDRLSTESSAFAEQTGEPSSSYLSESGADGEGTPSSATGDADSVTGTPSGTAGGSGATGGTGTGTATGDAGTATPTSGDGTGGTDSSGSGTETSDGGATGTENDTSGSDSEDDTSEGDSGEESDSGDDSDSDTQTGDEAAEEESDSTGSDGTENGSTASEPEPVDITLNRTAVPGATVAVTVTRGDEPVVGARVSFNGEPVGRTDENGTVVGEVPYARDLDITVEGERAETIDGGALPPLERDDPTVFGVSLGDAVDDLAGTAGTATADESPNGTTYPLETNATVSLVGDVRSNASVTVVATVADVPVREATVLLDGTAVATTDARGRATIRLPSTPGDHTLAVRRGPVEGNTTVSIDELGADHGVGWPLALPTAPVTVTATLGNDTLAGATVRSDGTRLGETGVDGNATVSLSASNGVTYTVAAYGQTATTTLTGAVTNAAGLAVALLALLGVVVRSGYRRGVSPRRIPGKLYRVTLRAVHAAVAGLVAVAEAITGGVTAIRRLVGVRSRAVALRAVPGRVAAAVGAAVAGAVAWLRGLPAAVASWWATRNDDPTDDAGSRAGGDSAGAETEARLTVRRAWRRFLSIAPVRGVRRRTPGEVARLAVGAGLPAGPVSTLRDAYREVEYGGGDPESRVGRVRGALATLTDEGDESAAEDASGADSAADEPADHDADDADGGDR